MRMRGHGAGKLTLAIGLTIAFGPAAVAQQSPAQALLRQQARDDGAAPGLADNVAQEENRQHVANMVLNSLKSKS